MVRSTALRSLDHALTGWSDDDIAWLAEAITSGNVTPPQPCASCGEPTPNTDGPLLCDSCIDDNDGDDDTEADSDDGVEDDEP